jgi:hypothetical protein
MNLLPYKIIVLGLNERDFVSVAAIQYNSKVKSTRWLFFQPLPMLQQIPIIKLEETCGKSLGFNEIPNDLGKILHF